jgi:hypothetical protein
MSTTPLRRARILSRLEDHQARIAGTIVAGRGLVHAGAWGAVARGATNAPASSRPPRAERGGGNRDNLGEAP